MSVNTAPSKAGALGRGLASTTQTSIARAYAIAAATLVAAATIAWSSPTAHAQQPSPEAGKSPASTCTPDPFIETDFAVEIAELKQQMARDRLSNAR